MRERFRDLVDIQIVAFPQSGILRSPGTAELLDAAITEGADLVAASIPSASTAISTDISMRSSGSPRRRGVGVDIHLHDRGESGIAQLTAIAAPHRGGRPERQGRGEPRLRAGLGADRRRRRTADLLAEAGVAIMSHGPGARHAALKLLHEHGVEVFGGSDNIRDAWSPFGNGDMLERAMMIGYRATSGTTRRWRCAFDMVTGAAARVLGIADYGIAVGRAGRFRRGRGRDRCPRRSPRGRGANW